jgi:hypothetical protein
MEFEERVYFEFEKRLFSVGTEEKSMKWSSLIRKLKEDFCTDFNAFDFG